jgi:hypothetical protein
MRAFTPRVASFRTSASASARVLYAASWMVQMPRGAAPRVVGSFVEAAPVGAFRAAEAVGVRVVTVSLRRGGVVLDVILVVLGAVVAGAGPVAGTLLGELGGGEDATAGEPDDRTPGMTVPGAAAPVAGVDGHREPW